MTIDRVAGVPVRHPDMVAAGLHYGCKVETCEPFDPESKGGAEHPVKIAKADLVPTSANLLPEYASFTELADACWAWASGPGWCATRSGGGMKRCGSAAG